MCGRQKHPPFSFWAHVWHLILHGLLRYLFGGVQKVDMTDAKRKYYGCFNSILSVYGKKRDDLISLHLVESYCLLRLLYSSEGISLNTLQIHEQDVIWNNAFRCIFNCCWRESVKLLQFYCVVQWLARVNCCSTVKCHPVKCYTENYECLSGVFSVLVQQINSFVHIRLTNFWLNAK